MRRYLIPVVMAAALTGCVVGTSGLRVTWHFAFGTQTGAACTMPNTPYCEADDWRRYAGLPVPGFRRPRPTWRSEFDGMDEKRYALRTDGSTITQLFGARGSLVGLPAYRPEQGLVIPWQGDVASRPEYPDPGVEGLRPHDYGRSRELRHLDPDAPWPSGHGAV